MFSDSPASRERDHIEATNTSKKITTADRTVSPNVTTPMKIPSVSQKLRSLELSQTKETRKRKHQQRPAHHFSTTCNQKELTVELNEQYEYRVSRVDSQHFGIDKKSSNEATPQYSGNITRN